MNDIIRIQQALTALGYKVSFGVDNNSIIGRHLDNGTITFWKNGDAYSAAGATDFLSPIAKKYAEIGIRNFAKRRGFNITKNDGTKIEMVQRRR
jgi:hypothetical protein